MLTPRKPCCGPPGTTSALPNAPRSDCAVRENARWRVDTWPVEFARARRRPPRHLFLLLPSFFDCGSTSQAGRRLAPHFLRAGGLELADLSVHSLARPLLSLRSLFEISQRALAERLTARAKVMMEPQARSDCRLAAAILHAVLDLDLPAPKWSLVIDGDR
jgi:hypothetical protein